MKIVSITTLLASAMSTSAALSGIANRPFSFAAHKEDPVAPGICETETTAVIECIENDTVDSDPVSCMNGCFDELDAPESCEEDCNQLDACYTNCFTGGTCKTEIYTMINCDLDSDLGPGVCNCAAAYEADAPAIESFGLNLAHALKKNLRASRAGEY
eukprot:CAMPEP_0201867236 /NCGR_PEP_ID=MMETSP0902-20130614/1541_1 /ASSEMBLY_ACC=CAM_ASM_000551 /TAXON_ID=420261 /ORGANISM="Thalassiosira antarctica, Strain CCMP982" /LENGTH=157 /DNA_ID=CAMNT_0048392361 /DNA_START=29 /DNA_END=502 /DNA_ORIENTATION=+